VLSSLLQIESKLEIETTDYLTRDLIATREVIASEGHGV